jgi:TonB family protein
MLRRFLIALSVPFIACVAAVDAQQPSGAPAEKTYFQFAPKRGAELLAGSPSPHYPRELQAQGIRGEVVAQFTVDTLGRVVPGTFVALQSPDALLTRALRANLVNLRFRPAEIGGHRVSQLVQLSFAFDPTTGSSADSAAAERDVASAAADSVAAVAGAGTSDRSFIASFRFDDEDPDGAVSHGLGIERHGNRDAVTLFRNVRGRRDTTLARLRLPGVRGSELLVIKSCTLDGTTNPEVIGLVPLGADGHRATDRPTRAWRASRRRGRFEPLAPARVRCEDEEDVD